MTNVLVLTYTYDDLKRLIFQKEIDRNGTVIAQYAYTLGEGGEREKVTETGACGNIETTYDYDNAGRLVKEVTTKSDQLNSEKKIYIYVYDAVGNRIEKVEDDTKTTYTYNSRNQLVSEETPTGKITYSYDANGNLLNKTGTGISVTYSYDVYNRLIKYADQSNTETYTYDAEGVRRSKKNATGELLFISDTTASLSMLLAETDSEGNLTASYTRADTLISQTREGATSTYLYDGHGDVRALLNEAGRITDKYRYTAYGDLIEQSGDTENHFRYTGEYYDGVSDLYYLRARYMSTETGIFISMDTYEGSIYDPDSLHKYLYANGNPVKYNDPSGNFFSAVEGIVATTINTIADNYRTFQVMGLISGFAKATIAAASGCSPEEITREFIDGYCIGFGVGALMYIAAACTALSIAQIFMFDVGFKSVMYLVLSIVAVTTKHPKVALEYYTLSILCLFTFAKLYNLQCKVNINGDKGSISIARDYTNSECGSDTTKLYRAMSQAEYDSVMENNKFVPYDYAMEDKWFATTLENAIKWGDIFYTDGNYRILEIEVEMSSLNEMYYVEYLDGIGPAYCSPLDILIDAILSIQGVK